MARPSRRRTTSSSEVVGVAALVERFTGLTAAGAVVIVGSLGGFALARLLGGRALLLLAYAGVLLVVSAAVTSRQDALHALGLLQRAHIRLSGTVLNAIPPWSERLYRHYLGERSAKYREAYTQSYRA